MMYKRISIDEVNKLSQQKPINVIDIRDPQAFAAGHMPQAININNQNAGDYIEKTDKTKPLIVVCYHGHSSQPAAQYFAAQGFEEVYSMDGGFEVWKLNNPVESG
ncbi:thiosulfate sulfurtransferase GlpE [Kangiella sediminilitoris]|uniref:Thiosulfate sulfurtransferase GlpE n=1 Tax=Kangiella sediminilitoris TaxID=1144748 RepID=A0A1B3B7P8_9GAMM|nr:thiosulfate sulfurtransferase GlpE [Kangiella sediminilitoris]AOE48813.1 Rhodanese domain protein [Kangiella sediminilitoris]